LPRSYSLGKRAAQQAETRKRIVDAALAVYEEKGVTATTMQDVARRADVAPGTVANHFGSARALASVATSQVLADLRMPTPDLFDGVEGIPDRIRLLISEIAAFFHRSESWYRVAQREPGNPAWAEAEARYYAELDSMIRTALGPLASDADAVAVVSAVLTTWVIGAMQASGYSGSAASGLVSDLLIAWLATRGGSPPTTPRPRQRRPSSRRRTGTSPA
jgi:AcrR family transcriptional regulator